MPRKIHANDAWHRIRNGEFKQSAEISTTYLDDDILIIDNIKVLEHPDPVHLQMTMIASCQQGHFMALVNGMQVVVDKNEVFLCPPNTMVDIIEVSDDFACAAVCITNRGIQNILRSHVGLWNDAMYVSRQRVIKMTELDMEFYDKFTALVRLCLVTSDKQPTAWNPFRREIVETLLKCGLLAVCNAILVGMPQEDAGKSSDATHALFDRFLDLLQHAERHHLPVAYFARELCVSSKYLSIVCKRHSGKTAIEWITEYTLADITYYLRSTKLSIKEIAATLGFSNASFFGKYVREHLHTSPLKYREKQNR